MRAFGFHHKRLPALTEELRACHWLSLLRSSERRHNASARAAFPIGIQRMTSEASIAAGLTPTTFRAKAFWGTSSEIYQYNWLRGKTSGLGEGARTLHHIVPCDLHHAT